MRDDPVYLLGPVVILEAVGVGILLIFAALYAVRLSELKSWALGAVVLPLAAMLGAALPYAVFLLALRRRFRFSLRVLLLATAVLGILLGTVLPDALEAWRRHDAFRAVIEAGGEFGYDLENHDERGWAESRSSYYPSRRLTGLTLRTDAAVVRVAQEIGYFSDVESVDLSSAVTDAGLAGAQCIARLPRLRYVGLSDLAITDAGLEMVSKWSRVHALCINGCAAITDDGLVHLERMNQLEQLLLVAEGGGALNITDSGLSHLARLPRLKSLALVGVTISDAGLDYLIELRHLKQVRLRRTKVTARGVERLRKGLSGCEVIWDGVSSELSATPKTHAVAPEEAGRGGAPGDE